MKAAAFLDRMDDLLNPIVVKELRQAVKSRIVIAALMTFLLIEMVVLLLSLSFDENLKMDAASLRAGRRIFEFLEGILLGTAMLLIPAYTGIRLSSEHSDTNVDLLFISTLRPRGIIAGKLQAAIVLILMIFSACAPFMTFTYLLRGIDVPSILLLLVLDFLIVLLAAQVAIFLGAVPTNPSLKLLLGFMGLGVLVELFVGTMIFSDQLLDFGVGSRLDSREFWIIAGAVTTLLLATTGLFFTWSVAIVSPSSANRALPVRLYLLGYWLLTGVTAALLTRQFRLPFALYIWECAILVLLCAQLVVSINEREHWGMRVQRTIPRRLWLRGPAFLIYSGAAGGVLLALLLLALTLTFLNVPLHYWIDSSLLLDRFETDIRPLINSALLLIALYTFNYCMTAVWLRHMFLASRFKATYTWVLAMILWALGSSLPFPLLFLFRNQEWRQGQVNPWWQITNPFSTIFTYLERRGVEAEVFRFQCLMFMSGWALIVLLGCLPWMIQQMKRFRPPQKSPMTVS